MAKLTVFFKDKIIHSGLYENGVIHIGRDESNDIVIDSLAVAPVHAVVIINEEQSKIKQLTDSFPLVVNGEKIKESSLSHGDIIGLGKHHIMFKASVTKETGKDLNNKTNDLLNQAVVSLNQAINRNLKLPSANLQVLAGDNIGKLIPLKNVITRLGHSGSGVVVIEKKTDGYYVSVLKNKGSIKLNNIVLNGTDQKISNLDILTIDSTSLQFFQS